LNFIAAPSSRHRSGNRPTWNRPSYRAARSDSATAISCPRRRLVRQSIYEETRSIWALSCTWPWNIGLVPKIGW